MRNLAMRAAEAARNTAGLIEGTVTRVKEGSDLVERTSKEFTQVAATASKMETLVSEITAASQEQAQGIEQINRAVTELDKVIQANAANAEESAAASEEMSSQAEHLKGFVNELVALVSGDSGDSTASASPAARERLTARVKAMDVPAPLIKAPALSKR